MPVERRPLPTKPLKTERTHEENQERAYIAASRRSDRSLEARIESARRASEIHKKRTGRGLRVTEQDVVNEEMYEEEDDDLPTQYQRLNAHLYTSSMMFNRKLHDYIAAQHGVRNMFMAQYQNQPLGAGHQFSSAAQPQMSPLPLGQQQNFAPQAFDPSSPMLQSPSQAFATPGSSQQQQQQQQSQPPQGYRQAPYAIPPRQQLHGRSASTATPKLSSNVSPSVLPNDANPSEDSSRRLSLPPNAFEQATDDKSRPTPSRTTTSQTAHRANSPRASATPPAVPDVSQMSNSNPLSLSLPPESQQLVGSALDWDDPSTAIFMSGYENIPQFFPPTYTYNPNLSPKATLSQNMSGTGIRHSDSLKVDTAYDTSSLSAPSSAMPDNLDDMFSSPTFDGGFFDHSVGDLDQSLTTAFKEEFDDSQYLQFD